MPWELKKRGGKVLVCKKGADEPVPGGVHPNATQAKKHLAALYASEKGSMGAQARVAVIERATFAQRHGKDGKFVGTGSSGSSGGGGTAGEAKKPHHASVEALPPKMRAEHRRWQANRDALREAKKGRRGWNPIGPGFYKQDKQAGGREVYVDPHKSRSGFVVVKKYPGGREDSFHRTPKAALDAAERWMSGPGEAKLSARASVFAQRHGKDGRFVSGGDSGGGKGGSGGGGGGGGEIDPWTGKERTPAPAVSQKEVRRAQSAQRTGSVHGKEFEGKRTKAGGTDYPKPPGWQTLDAYGGVKKAVTGSPLPDGRSRTLHVEVRRGSAGSKEWVSRVGERPGGGLKQTHPTRTAAIKEADRRANHLANRHRRNPTETARTAARRQKREEG